MNGDRKLVWIDLEMTGLDPQQHVILEIATIITDSNLTILEEGPSFIIHQPDEYLALMDDWVRTTHTNSGLLEQVYSSTTSLEQAQEATLFFIKQYCQPGTALLAGNTVWKDKEFLEKYMPEIIEYLFYRLIDVSTIKELVGQWYPHDPKRKFKKREAHRALDDIRLSIDELKHFRHYFFIKNV